MRLPNERIHLDIKSTPARRIGAPGKIKAPAVATRGFYYGTIYRRSFFAWRARRRAFIRGL